MRAVEFRTGSAITVLNAIRADKGSAIGTRIFTSVRMTEGEEMVFKVTDGMDTRLVESCVEVFTDQVCTPVNGKIEVRSPLPAARGLKTSSAVSLGILGTLALISDVDLSPHELVSLSADSSIRAGVSITGAIDDAYASLLGGLAVTDTRERRLVKQVGMDAEPVVLLVPKRKNEKQHVDILLEDIDRGLIASAISALDQGDYRECIRLNTMAYGPLLGDFGLIQKLSPLADRVGLNGAGPSLFLLNPKVGLEAIRTQAPLYDVILTSTSDYRTTTT